jgi:hypothetical protein
VVTPDLDMPMPAGRELGDWTIAELRALNGAFAEILAKVGEVTTTARCGRSCRG